MSVRSQVVCASRPLPFTRQASLRPTRVGRSASSCVPPPPPPRPPSTYSPTTLSRALRLLPIAIALPVALYALSTGSVIELDEAQAVTRKTGGRAKFPVGDPVVVRAKDGIVTADELQSHRTREDGVWVVIDGDVWE